jgi:hypothetical protein
MATQAYKNWVRDGRPSKVAAPVKALGDRLRSYGYTVYYIGSDDRNHLQADRPEDHCPFSTSGWPVPHPYPYITALDIMPFPGSSLPTLQQLGAQLVADRNAGHPGLDWLKYMNWETQRNWGGPCYQDSWKPSYARRTSNDRGHIHASGRSDMVHAAGAAATYDPVARIRANISGGDDMDFNARVPHTENSDNPGGIPLWAVLKDIHDVTFRAGIADRAARLEVLAAADEKRDLAVKATLDLVAAAIQSGGGSVDVAAIKSHIDQVAAKESAAVVALHDRVADLEERLAEAHRAAAGAFDPTRASGKAEG